MSFAIRRADLEFVGRDLKWIAEPGVFDVWIAPSSVAGTAKTFRLLAEHDAAATSARTGAD